jgi:PAS domain S-box-containing protein
MGAAGQSWLSRVSSPIPEPAEADETGPGNSPPWAAWGGLITSDGAFVVDLQQRIVFWSPTAQRLTGYAPEEVLRRPCFEVIGGRDPRNQRFCRRDCPVVMNARRGRPTPNYDVLCPLGQGNERWLNFSILLVKGKGAKTYILHLFRDVTAHRRLEESARQTAARLRETSRPAFPASEPPALPVARLSPREIEVLRLLACGLTIPEIATTLSLRPITVRNYVSRLLTKLGVRNRLQAVIYASRLRLI